MARSVIKKGLPFKILYLEDAEFTFNNHTYSDGINLKTITNNVVSEQNIIGVIATSFGNLYSAALSGNKTKVELYHNTVLNVSINVNLIIFYK